MSKPVGRVLDSKVGKGMVKVGNMVKRNTPGKLISSAIKKESDMAKAKDAKYRREAPYGAYGTSTYQSKK